MVLFIIVSDGMKDDIEIDLPKLKNDTKERKSIVVNDISGTYVIKSDRRLFFLIVIILILIILFLVYAFLIKKDILVKENNVFIKDIEIINYNVGSNKVDIAIIPSEKQKFCALSSEKGSIEELDYQKLSNDKCYVTIGLETNYIYFKDNNEVVSKKLEINDFVVKVDLNKQQYYPVGVQYNIYENMIVVGEPEVNWVTLGDVVSIKDNKYFVTNKVGNTMIQAVVNNKVVVDFEVVVTDVIVQMPEKFDDNKSFLTCEAFTSDEAALLDTILETRINDAGYGTRAGAVAAARFLTLEFPYRISYYWENGRLNNTGKHYVDGEGRYYHKGLYLDSSKYDSIEASLFGPAMWGCKMVSYEDDPPNFVPGRKYPNGLDCSGFVSWALLNGGFDVGDRGAGESPSKGQLTDLGEFKTLNKSLINSGKIKVGDLFNFWGHIAILIGQDENNYYIAESLNNYKGVVVKTYSKNKVMNTFKYVVLMDSVYNGDGNLKDMWY